MLTDWFEVHDPRFTKLVFGNVHVDTLHTGCMFTEGPAWFGAGRYLVFSDIPANRLYRWDETNGAVAVFREPTGNTNGNTVDREGRLVSCEHTTRRVTRTEHDGRITVLVDNWQGKRFNSPNDVVVKSDGSIWFSDPPTGIELTYFGELAPSEMPGAWYWRLDPATGVVEPVITDIARPNGLAFSPDEKILYAVECVGSRVPGGPRTIRAYDVGADGKTLSGSRVFAECKVGIFDGFRVDVHGNVWTSAGDGVWCFAPDGTPLGRIRIPEVVANVGFGGAKRNRLFITATHSLYAVYLNTQGAAWPTA
ncbi:MAG: SMP-30/gluconolactonase/LRE family protein [Alphaproteobacteria bacterium]